MLHATAVLKGAKALKEEAILYLATSNVGKTIVLLTVGLKGAAALREETLLPKLPRLRVAALIGGTTRCLMLNIHLKADVSIIAESKIAGLIIGKDIAPPVVRAIRSHAVVAVSNPIRFK